MKTGSRFGKFLRTALIAGLLSALVFGLALAYLLHTTHGRERLASGVSHVISKEIPGWVEIGQLERAGVTTVVRNLQFFHPNGEQVLHVGHATIDFNWIDALGGKLSFERAKVKGGRLVLKVGPDGRPTIEAAVDFPSRGVDPDPHGGLHYAMRNIAFEDLNLLLSLGQERYDLHSLRGVLTIRREVTSGVRIELRDITGHVQQEVFGSKARLLGLRGWVHGKEKQVLHLDARAKLGQDTLRAQIKLFDREKTPVKIDLWPITGLGDFPSTLAMKLLDLVSGDVDIDMHAKLGQD